MGAIEAIVFAGSAGFTLVAVATILVIIGVRHEERLATLTSHRAPTVPAALARLVLGTYAHQPPEEQNEHDGPN
jgi:hypothetical protein